jgi:hypothetical protein
MTGGWDLTPCSRVEVCRRFGIMYECDIHLHGRIVKQARKPQITWLQVRPSETSADFYRTTRRYIPDLSVA